MPRKQQQTASGPAKMNPGVLRNLLKVIGNLSRQGMDAGNRGDFEKAFLNIEDALAMSRDLNKKCLEAKLLNNLGILHTMHGTWENAMNAYDESMDIVSSHYGTQNFLYKTLQKNIGYLFDLDVSPAA